MIKTWESGGNKGDHPRSSVTGLQCVLRQGRVFQNSISQGFVCLFVLFFFIKAKKESSQHTPPNTQWLLSGRKGKDR